VKVTTLHWADASFSSEKLNNMQRFHTLIESKQWLHPTWLALATLRQSRKSQQQFQNGSGHGSRFKCNAASVKHGTRNI